MQYKVAAVTTHLNEELGVFCPSSLKRRFDDYLNRNTIEVQHVLQMNRDIWPQGPIVHHMATRTLLASDEAMEGFFQHADAQFLNDGMTCCAEMMSETPGVQKMTRVYTVSGSDITHANHQNSPHSGAVFVTAYHLTDSSLDAWVKGELLSNEQLLGVLENPDIPLDVKAIVLTDRHNPLSANGAINHLAYMTPNVELSMGRTFPESVANQIQVGATMKQQSNLTVNKTDYTEFVELTPIAWKDFCALTGQGADGILLQKINKENSAFLAQLTEDSSVVCNSRFKYERAKVLFLSSFAYVFDYLMAFYSIKGTDISDEQKRMLVDQNIAGVLGTDHHNQELVDRLYALCKVSPQAVAVV